MAALRIGAHDVGRDFQPFFIAEVSANHHGRLQTALDLIDAAAMAGASAVKFQHYKPETITIRSPLDDFQIRGGTLWDGRELFDLYAEAMTPWEWTTELFRRARERGLACFSSPFDSTAVDFLEDFEPDAYKVASFELVDLPLIRYMARTERPIIMSTGMATLDEIDRAVDAAREAGCEQLALLRCNSGYPASPNEMDLAAIPFMRDRYNLEVGLSDHTLDPSASCAAVALGATLLEKHIILNRHEGGPDAPFSIEPQELEALINQIEIVRSSVGQVRFGPSDHEGPSLKFRRSLRVTSDLKAGHVLTSDDVRSMRPAGGLDPDAISQVIGRTLVRDLPIGSALDWDAITP